MNTMNMSNNQNTPKNIPKTKTDFTVVQKKKPAAKRNQKNKAKYEPKNPEKYAAKKALKAAKLARKREKTAPPTEVILPTPAQGPVLGLALSEFPSLEDAANTKEVKEKFSTKRSGEVHTSYVVATSYRSSEYRSRPKEGKYSQTLRERYGNFERPRPKNYDVNAPAERDHVRDRAFSNLENKGALTQSLTCTKACKHVIDGTKEVDGAIVYGVCHRSVCSFAHSLEELQDPTCTFGDSCRYVNSGKSGRVCRFRHPFETREMYVERVGVEKVNLPQTAELTRDPREPKFPRLLRDTRDTQESKIAEVEKALQEFKLEQELETPKETVIQVPEEMFEQAMETALKQGMTNFRIEVTA